MEVGDALACKKRCEKQVEPLGQREGTAKKPPPDKAANLRRSARLFGFYALCFLTAGAGLLWFEMNGDSQTRVFGYVFLLSGALMFGGALNTRLSARKLQKQKAK